MLSITRPPLDFRSKLNVVPVKSKPSPAENVVSASMSVLSCVRVIFLVRLLSLASAIAIESLKFPAFESAASPSILSLKFSDPSSSKPAPAKSETSTFMTPEEAESPSPANPVATLSLIMPSSIAFASIVNAPPAAIVASPETFAKIASSRFENVTFFSVPASERIKLSV